MVLRRVLETMGSHARSRRRTLQRRAAWRRASLAATDCGWITPTGWGQAVRFVDTLVEKPTRRRFLARRAGARPRALAPRLAGLDGLV